MAANTSPIFPLTPNISWASIATANTTKDLTSGSITLVFTAGSNGARLDTIKVRHKGTNVATVLRVWINNGLTNTNAANNTLYTEQSIAANTLDEAAAATDVEIAMDLALPPSYLVYVTIGTTVAAGLHVSASGGNY